MWYSVCDWATWTSLIPTGYLWSLNQNLHRNSYFNRRDSRKSVPDKAVCTYPRWSRFNLFWTPLFLFIYFHLLSIISTAYMFTINSKGHDMEDTVRMNELCLFCATCLQENTKRRWNKCNVIICLRAIYIYIIYLYTFINKKLDPQSVSAISTTGLTRFICLRYKSS